MVLLLNDLPKMDPDRKEITKRILNFTLEIIYLLTGEDYTVVKKTSGESVAPSSPLDESEGWSRSQSPIMEPLLDSLIPESKNEKKILEVIHKMVELLTGEVPVRCQDVTVYFSLEEWEYIEGHKDVYQKLMMEEHKPLMLQDGSSKKKKTEKIPAPLCSPDRAEEKHVVTKKRQASIDRSARRNLRERNPQDRPEQKYRIPKSRKEENLIDIKVEVLDEEEMDYKEDDWGKERKTLCAHPPIFACRQSSPSLHVIPTDGLHDRNLRERRRAPMYSQEYAEEKHHVLRDHQGEYLIDIKLEAEEEEEDERMRSDHLCMTEMEEDSLVDVITGVYTGNSTILKTLRHKAAFTMPGSGDYRRMGIDVGGLISEVQARPYLWDSSVSGYSDRRLREQSWLEITQALYPDWGKYSQSKQWNILKDIKTRWKSVRDRFLKEERNAERGSADPRRRKCPFHDELMFLLPIRRPRKSRGNYRGNQSRTESADEDDGQQPTPSGSTPAPQEMEGETEELAGPSWVSRSSSPSEETAAASTRTSTAASPPAPTRPARPGPHTRSASIRRQSRRILRSTERQLEIESRALSPIRRLDADDEYDIFGYTIASRCRQMHPEVRDTFIAYVGVVATVFDTAYPLPKLGDLINHLRAITGLSNVPPSYIPRCGLQSSSTQTEPVSFKKM